MIQKLAFLLFTFSIISAFGMEKNKNVEKTLSKIPGDLYSDINNYPLFQAHEQIKKKIAALGYFVTNGSRGARTETGLRLEENRVAVSLISPWGASLISSKVTPLFLCKLKMRSGITLEKRKEIRDFEYGDEHDPENPIRFSENIQFYDIVGLDGVRLPHSNMFQVSLKSDDEAEAAKCRLAHKFSTEIACEKKDEKPTELQK